MQPADWELGFFLITIILYAVATVLYLFAPSLSARRYRRLAAMAGVAFHAMSIALRAFQTWQLERRLPMSSQFELANIVILLLILCYLILEKQETLKFLGAYVMPLATAIMIYTAYLPRGIQPLSDSLKTYWLKVHVSSAIFAYTAFLFAAALAIMFLAREHGDRGRYELEDIDRLAYRVVLIGFPFMTLLLISGILWAKVAWNRYWGWDPKEIWGLMTWLAYGVLLFGRRYLEWRGRLAAWVAIFAFASVMFTYAGVNMLLSSLHGY